MENTKVLGVVEPEEAVETPDENREFLFNLSINHYEDHTVQELKSEGFTDEHIKRIQEVLVAQGKSFKADASAPDNTTKASNKPVKAGRKR